MIGIPSTEQWHVPSSYARQVSGECQHQATMMLNIRYAPHEFPMDVFDLIGKNSRAANYVEYNISLALMPTEKSSSGWNAKSPVQFVTKLWSTVQQLIVQLLAIPVILVALSTLPTQLCCPISNPTTKRFISMQTGKQLIRHACTPHHVPCIYSSVLRGGEVVLHYLYTSQSYYTQNQGHGYILQYRIAGG